MTYFSDHKSIKYFIHLAQDRLDREDKEKRLRKHMKKQPPPDNGDQDFAR